MPPFFFTSILIANIVTTSKAPVTTSVALASTSFLLSESKFASRIEHFDCILASAPVQTDLEEFTSDLDILFCFSMFQLLGLNGQAFFSGSGLTKGSLGEVLGACQAQPLVASLLLVARPGAPSSFLFLVAMPGAPRTLAPRSKRGISKVLILAVYHAGLCGKQHLLLHRAYVGVVVKLL